MVMPATLYAWASFIMFNKKNDHLPARLEAVLNCRKTAPVARRRRSVYDRRAVFDACKSDDPAVLDKVHKLDHYLSLMPPVPLRVDPTTHEHIVGQYVLDGVVSFFPPTIRMHKQDYLSSSTFALVSGRAFVNHVCCGITRMLLRAVIWFIMRFWRAVAWSVISSVKKPKPWWCRIRGPMTKALCLKQVSLNAAYNRLSIQVKDACQSGFLAICSSKCSALEEAALEGCCG